MLKTHGRSEPFQVRGEIATHGNAKPCKASVDAPIRPMFPVRPTATGEAYCGDPGLYSVFGPHFWGRRRSMFWLAAKLAL